GHDAAALARVQLHALHLHAGPVGVVAEGERRTGVVHGRLHQARDARATTVGADDDPRLFFDDLTLAGVAADAPHALTVRQHVLDGEPFADLDARLLRGVEERFVQQRPTRAEVEVDVARGQGI